MSCIEAQEDTRSNIKQNEQEIITMIDKEPE